MSTTVRVSLEAVDDNATTIMQHLDLPLLLSKLREKKAFTTEQLERLSNPAHSMIERTGYLLQYVKKLHQKGVDVFVQSLREAKCPGHDEILTLLKESSTEGPVRSPLLEVFENKRADIVSHLSFTTFIKKLMEMEVVSVHENMEIYSPHRSMEENCWALMALLMQRPGAQGLLKFIEGLHEDSNPKHKVLATVLLGEAASVVQDHPRRADIPQGDKTQLLHLERWRETGTPSDVNIKMTFMSHESRLRKEVNVSALLPLLLKRKVLSEEEGRELNQLKGEERAPRLVTMVSGKGMKAIVAFVDCIRQSPEHEKLARVFEMTPAKKTTVKPSTEKTNKLAVLICMDNFLEFENDYDAKEMNVREYNDQFEDHRDSLRMCLERLEFVIVDFGKELSDNIHDDARGPKPPTRNALFDKKVAARCNKDATVFIFLTGLQFPLKLAQKGEARGEERFCGAVLMDGTSVLSRRESECITMDQLKYWVELLPTYYVTVLIDCHHSHVVSYGKERLPSQVEIMTSPWSSLYGTDGVVLYFCQPDPEAMWRLRGSYSEKPSVFGKLTEIFVKALISWIRRGHKMEVSHRLFYESISFHWHKRGRVHNLFVPAIQGDVDRSFLGTSSFPYLQVLRADLTPDENPDTQDRYDLTKLQVSTGTQLGLIKDDELLMFHILLPEVKVAGKVTRAHPLSSVAEVRAEDREKFSRLLTHIYEEEEVSPDGSMEFVLLKKKFPFHVRDNYAVFCHNIPESDKETIVNYINKSSHLLSYAHNRELARLLVQKEGQFFSVEDTEVMRGERGEKIPVNDILFKPRVKTIQNVKSVLEIMAWFKHVKNLRTETDLHHFCCYLVCEKPLLMQPPPPTEEFQIKASTHTGVYPATEAILQFSGEPHFWCPDKDDHTPTLEVEFERNRIMTAVEVRGDPEVKGYIQQADLIYRKLVFHTTRTAPDPKKPDCIPVSCQEKACFVVFKPQEWDGDFCIALRVLVAIPSHERGRARTRGVSSLTVMYWQYLQKPTNWSIAPEPSNNSKDVHAALDLSHTDNMLRWTGHTNHPITFDLGQEQLVESIEIACVPGTKPLRKFRVELCSQWYCQPIPSIPSAWSFKYQLPRPLVVSNLQLCPVKLSEAPFRVQLQMYGNEDEKTVVAEERDVLQLHFVNFTEQCHFVYLYYLEETGKVEIVLADVVLPNKGLKKLIRVNIPEGYNPVAKKIRDQYRVLVSPKKIYLEPLNQLGLHEYMGVRTYNPCYMGRRTDIGKDEQWYEYKFDVIVRKGAGKR